jgi:hypothetical protein
MEFNVFALHTRWNTREIAKVMGGDHSPTTYITILRDPVDRFISFLDFNKIQINMEKFAFTEDKSKCKIPRMSIENSR